MKAIIFLSILFLISVLFAIFLKKSGIIKILKLEQKDNLCLNNINSKEIIDYIEDDNSIDLKFEQFDGEKYIPHRFVDMVKSESDNISGRKLITGRGSWRATQGNIYSLFVFKKDLADEFNERL